MFGPRVDRDFRPGPVGYLIISVIFSGNHLMIKTNLPVGLNIPFSPFS